MKQFVIVSIFVLCLGWFSAAESLPHPTIWVTEAERAEVLGKMERYEWAASLAVQYHELVDARKQAHEADPASTLRLIPEFGDHMEEHNEVLTLAMHSGILYFLTKDESYAQLSADIVAAYAVELADKTPQTTEIMGEAFMDGRTTYPQLALAYDFIYPFIKKSGTTVFDLKSQVRRPFDNAAAQKMLWNMAGNILQEYSGPDHHGSLVSNHPILTAPGALYPILCLEDEAERERLLHIFWEVGTHHQNSFKNTLLPLYSEQGLWPESLSYSFMPLILTTINILDRVKPELGAIDSANKIMEGTFLFPNLKNPDGTFVRYGDSKRYNDFSAELFRNIINISERRGFDEMKRKAEIVLKKQRDEKGGYKPMVTNSVYDNSSPLELFWGMDLGDQIVGKFDYKPTVVVEHAGVVLQRNWVEEDNELYGLNGIIGGATYVHSHLTGIAMELYGAGYVLGPNAGLPKTVKERLIPLHEHYFRLYAGNNTVVVNGSSHGLQEGSWKDKAHLWQDTVFSIAAEPSHLEDPISEVFSFATQHLDDTVNQAQQERTLAVVRTSPTTAYYFDMFRSRSLGENKFHDYIYHNVGDETKILDTQGTLLPLTSTDRYDNDIGDIVKSPGWRFFEDEKTTKATAEAVTIQFNVNHNKRKASMHLFVPDGVEREYTYALAPPTREARNGYVDKKTQVVVIRQNGEAWKRPFIGVFEPSVTQTSSVVSVEQIASGDRVVGAKVVSKLKDLVITDVILCLDSDDATFEDTALGLSFKGRYGVARLIESGDSKSLRLYLGRGERLSYRGTDLVADAQGKGVLSVNLK